MKKHEALTLLQNNLPMGLSINSSVLSDNITEMNGGYEFYMRSGRYLKGNDDEAWANTISGNIGITVDSKPCDRDYDFYILVGASYSVSNTIAIEEKEDIITYPDFWREDVQIEGNHEFLKKEVAPLLEKLGYKRRNHYSWDIHFQRIIINSASKTTLKFEKGTFVSDCMSSSQSFFKDKLITIDDIKKIIKTR